MNNADLTVLQHYANLIAAGRATLRAELDGEPDPTWYLRDELRGTGHLPADLDEGSTTERSAR